MNKNKRKIIVLSLLFFLLIFLSTENFNFFYEIVSNFYILYDNLNLNHFIIYYRYYEQVKQRYFIYGYDSQNDKSYGFSPESEFITTKPFVNSYGTAFAYGALYQGNDFVWYKDFQNKLGYKILYSISGKLSLLSLDNEHKNIIVGFDYLAPQQFLYISGVKEFYTYPLTSYPNIVETGFTPDKKYVYVIYRYENRYNCDIVALSGDPYHSSSYKPQIKNIFKDAQEIIFIGNNGFITKEKDTYFSYNLKDYSITKIRDISIIKDNNDEKNCLLLIDGILYDKNFEGIAISLEASNIEKKINDKFILSYLKLNKNLFFSDRFLLVKDENNLLYLFEYISERKVLSLSATIKLENNIIESLNPEKLKLINLYENNVFFLIENSYFSGKSALILIFNMQLQKFETIYSDNISGFIKALNTKTGFAFLVKKTYSKGIFSELYYFSFLNKSIKKISGWENVQDAELNYLIRKN